ncbi:MAG: DUF6531 domain-containing protein [Actinoplanes sp.]
MPSPDAVRHSVPPYLRDSRTLGIAEQLRGTEGADLVSALGTLDSRLPADIVALVQADSRNDVDQFLGEGRPYPVTLDGGPAELRVRAVLDWDAVTVEKRHDDPGKVTAKTQETLAHALRHNRDMNFEPKATVVAAPGLLVGMGGSVPLAPATDHSTVHKSKYTSTTTVKVADLAEVTVPIRFVAELIGSGGPSSGPVETAGTVAIGVPTKLKKLAATAAAGPVPALNAPVPAQFGVESVQSRPGEEGGTFFDQVQAMLAEDGLGDLVRVGAPGRPMIQQLLSEAAFSGNLAKMVVTDPANRRDGWIRSESLPRAAEKGWRRFFPGRSQQIEVRLVARHLDEVESVDEATHIDTSALAAESTDSSIAKRLWNLWGTAGGGTDISPLSLVIAPRISGTRKGGFTQAIAEQVGAKQTLKATTPGVRYHGEYDVQVRVLGRPPKTLSGSVNTFQWTTRDRLRNTVLDPDRSTAPWHGRHGADRTHFAPPRTERGDAFGGAFITRLGDGGLHDVVADAVRSAPGGGRFRLPTHDELLQHFDDPELTEGLSPAVQAALARDADLDTQLSPDQLRHLADRIVGPGLKIPLIRNGALHDYTSVVTVQGKLDSLSDGDVIDRADVEASDKKRSKSTVTSTKDTSKSAELGLDARILGPIGRATSTLLGGPRASVSWGGTDETAITGGQATESSHGPALDTDGKPDSVRLREFAGELEVTVTSQSTVRVNEAGRQLSAGLSGRGLPTVLGTIQQPPSTRRLDLRMLIPEHRVSRQRPDLRPSPVPRDQEQIEHPLPIGRITGGYPHDLDGRRVESFVGADRLQEAVMATLEETGEGDIPTFADGRVSTAVADGLSPERLTSDAELFSRPQALSNLFPTEETSADVRVRLRPTNPKVLEGTEFSLIKRTFASGSSSKAKRGQAIELSASGTSWVPLLGGSVDHGATTGTPGAAVVLSVTPWRRAWGRVREQGISGVSKLRVGGRPERELLVQLDVDAEVVAEARHDTSLLPLALWPASPTRRAGRRLTLPGAVIMRMTPAELKQLQDRDRIREQQSSDVRLQVQHAERSEAMREEHREQRTSMMLAQVRERGDLLRKQLAEARGSKKYVDKVRRDRTTTEAEQQLAAQALTDQSARHQQELDRLTGAHTEATQRLRDAQGRQQAVLAAHQQRERDIVRREQLRQNESAAETDVPVPVTPPPFRPGPQRSYGIGGVATPVDLSNRIPHLRQSLARATTRELADAILPVELGRSPYDNVRGLTVSSFAGAAHLHLSSALNGGRTEPVQLEKRFRGATYHVTLTAEPLGEPKFTGLDLVGELSVTDRSTVSGSDAKTASRTVGSVSLTARAQGRETDKVEGNATDTTGNGPANATLGVGLLGTVNLDERNSTQTSSDGRTYEQALTVAGPVAKYRGPVRFTLTVTGPGLPAEGVSVHEIHDVTAHSATEGRPLARSGPVTPVPAAETTDAARRAWREADGFDSLPAAGRFAVEDVLVSLPDLHAAALQALTDSGAEVDDATRAALRNGLNVTQAKTLPAMLAGTFRLPSPSKPGRGLYLDARLVARPKVLRADATVKIGGSHKQSRDTKFEQTAGHSFAVKLNGPMVTAGVNHPGGANRIGERQDFNAVYAYTYHEQQLYRTDPASVVNDAGTLESGRTTQRPTERVDKDDKLTRALEYGVEFRFIADSPDSKGKHRAGTEITVPGGYVIRLDDAAARKVTGQELPPDLRASALAVADAEKTLLSAAGRLDGLNSQADPDPQALIDAERARLDAENAWLDAYNAHEAELSRPTEPAGAGTAQSAALEDVPPAAVAKTTAETPTVGDPIDVTTGRMIYTETDVRLPGLTLERTHRSDYRWGRSFGPSWASTLDQRVIAGERQAWVLAADGSIGTYPLPAEDTAARPVLGGGAPLRRLVGGGWLLVGPDSWLLFAPARDGEDALLSDVVTAGEQWSIERAEDGTPELLRSSIGTVVVLDTADGLVTGARIHTDEDGDVVELPSFGYDNARNLTAVGNSSGAETRLDYDDAGRIVRWEDRNGEWFTYVYDRAGRCVGTDGNGGYLRYSFRYGNGVTVVTNSLGQVTRYELNERLQVTAIVDPLGAVTHQEWDEAGRLLSRTDPLGSITRFGGEEQTRPIRDETHGVPLEGFDLDGLGRIRALRGPDGTVTEYGWTEEGDLAWQVHPDGSEQQWHYDGEGNLMEVIDAMGRVVNLEYGPFDLPTARIDEMGNRTEFTYDTELRLIAVTNPAGQVWRYAYDPAGRLSEQTDFDGRTQLYVHDDTGRLIAHTDAAGTTAGYDYDALGRVVERQVGENITRLEYDAEGRVTSAVSPDAVVRFERDEQGRVIAETINGRTVRTSYHSESDAVATRTTPSGRVSRWTFDADGRPDSLATGGHLVEFEHDAAGREISRTMGDVVALRQSFDAVGRLAGQHIAGAAERGFAYDAVGRITAITDSLAGDRTFTADDAGRIRVVTGDGVDLESYDFDEAGNLAGAGGEPWELDGTMLVRSDDATYEYDEKGRLAVRIDTVGTWRFAWDDENRMVQAITPGGDRWRYLYDGFGRRIAKQRLGDSGEVLEETSFAWSGDLLLEQNDGRSTTTWDYRPDGSAPVAQTDDDTLRTVITDTIGTPTHLVASNGALSWWSRGDLWGRNPEATATPLRFPGQYFDAETGLHYNRFRYYDPATARYLSPDPLGLSGGPNPTAYVTDPLALADPLGLTSCKPAQPSLDPVAAINPAPDQSSEPSTLPTGAVPPSPDALYGMPQWVRVTVRHRDGSFSHYRNELRDTPSPPLDSTPSGQVMQQAQSWFNDVAPATQDALAEGSSAPARQTYEQVRQDMRSLVGTAPRTGARSNREGQFNDPLIGATRPYNDSINPRTGRVTEGIGNRIANEPGGGRRTAAEIANYLRGHPDGLEHISSSAGREFATIVNFAERARGYDSEVNRLPLALEHIFGAERSEDARAQWRTIRAWFPPAAPGYAAAEYVPPESRVPVADMMPQRQRPNAPTRTDDYYVVDAEPSSSSRNDRSRSPEPESREPRSRHRDRSGRHHHRHHHHRHRDRSRYGFQDAQTAVPANLLGTASPITDQAPLADQLAALDGNPQAQNQVLDSFRDQLSRSIPLSNGSTLQVLASNVHGATANTEADLDALNNVDRGHLQQINNSRDGSNTNDCIPLTLAVDAYRQSGAITQVPPQTQPMALSTVTQQHPGRSVNEVGSINGLMDALGAMPNGTTGIVGLRAGAPGGVGHVINVSKDPQGRVSFEDAQVPGLAVLPAVEPNGSVFLLQTSDPAPVADTVSDVADNATPDFTPTPAAFNDVTPEAVVKSTEQTPTVGDPIDVTTGRMILTHTDAVLPGLTLERTFRSDYRWGRSFGRAWASTLDQRVIIDGEQVRYLAADGSVLTYALPAEGDATLPSSGRALPLRRLVGGGWLLTDNTTGSNLLFAPANSTESLLSDVNDGGVRWSVRRDRQGTPTELLSSTGASIVFTSSTGLVTSVSLPNEAGDLMVASQFGYDRDLNLVEVINSSGAPEQFEYADGRIVRWEDRNGEWYTYTYDEAGRCISTDGKGGYLAYRFDYQQGRTTVTDSLGAVRTYELNDRFQVVAETDPLGATTHNVWDQAYRLRSTTDALGRTTSSEYDADGRLIMVTRPDGSRSTTTYDDLGRAVSWTDFDGNTRNRQFGPDGLMIAEVDASGEVVRYEQPAQDGEGTTIHVGPNAVVRNPARQITSMTTSLGKTEYVYDALGRIFSMQDDRGLTEFGWTLEGDLAWRETDDGGLEEFLYDGEGNLIESVDATGRRTLREYGAFDLVTAEIDDEGKRTEYAYDTELRLVTITNPAGETWNYTYDLNGRIVQETDFGGRTQRYAYDAAGQLVEHTDAAGEVTFYRHDVLGNVIERRTGTAVTQFVYDAAGRVVAARDADSEIRLERDTLGRVVSETVNGNTVSTSYSEQVGAVAARSRPSGAVTQWSYDESGRPAVLAAGGQQVKFGYDGGREVSRVSDAGLALQQTFDQWGRLSAQRIAGVTDRRYTYDATGQLTAVQDAVQGDRRLDAEVPGDVRYTHDALGRPVTRTDAAGEWKFSWNHENRLTAVVTPGQDRWAYRYDAFGRRIAKQRLGSKGAVLEEITFVWSGDLLVEQHHRTRAGVSTTGWEYHPAVPHPVALVMDGAMYTVVTDGTGAPMDVVSVDGKLTGDADMNPLRVGGRYFDAETGLQYDRSRYYDPAAARFLPEPRTVSVPQ